MNIPCNSEIEKIRLLQNQLITWVFDESEEAKETRERLVRLLKSEQNKLRNNKANRKRGKDARFIHDKAANHRVK